MSLRAILARKCNVVLRHSRLPHLGVRQCESIVRQMEEKAISQYGLREVQF